MKPSVPGRIHAQVLDSPRLTTAADVVRHLGCVQSQLYDLALWAVARRSGLTLAEVDAAFQRGDFVRTHVLRPTWHFVDPADIRWLLALTAPRIRRLMASTNRSIGLTEERLDRGAEVIVAGLADGASRSRAELAVMLSDAGLEHSGQALAHIVMHAEIDALIVSGPMRDKQHTYVLLPEATLSMSRDDQLGTAARRYALGHGPFRDKDLAWWTSLTLVESRRAIELADLRPLDVDGQAYWALDAPVAAAIPPAMLLSNFDEYISYARDPDDYELFDRPAADTMRGTGLLMLDGRLAGSWTRAVSPSAVDIQIRSSLRLTRSWRRAIEFEAAAFGHAVGRGSHLTIAT